MRVHPPVGLARILLIYTKILNEVFPNLCKLTIHIGQGHKHYDNRWDDEYPLTYEERTDSAVMKVIEGLPNIQELQLGN
jgi:hypothetical protein